MALGEGGGGGPTCAGVKWELNGTSTWVPLIVLLITRGNCQMVKAITFSNGETGVRFVYYISLNTCPSLNLKRYQVCLQERKYAGPIYLPTYLD